MHPSDPDRPRADDTIVRRLVARLSRYFPPRAESRSDGATGARSVFSRGQRVLLLAGFVLLVILRLPRAWEHGRFLGEEATIFLAYAWHRPWIDALFRSFAGYWNFGANATTLLVATLVRARIVSLEHAPYMTMTMALVVQALPAVLLLTGRASWLAGRAAIVAALLIVATAPATEEVFLNVLHIQFHLALCAALILALDVPDRAGARVGYHTLLFLGPLCGPGAIVILPLFGVRALMDRDRGRLTQFAAFGAGAAVQILLFYGHSQVRGHGFGMGYVLAMLFVRLIALPILSTGKANRIGEAIYGSQIAGGTGWWWSVAAAVFLFGLLIAVAARRRDAAVWLVVAALAIAMISFGFGMIVIHRFDLFSVGAGERYNFLPLVLLGLALVALAMRTGSPARPVYALLVLLLLLTGVLRYPRPLSELSTGPSWPAEVAAWRRDHGHALTTWPASWSADLSDATSPCPPPGAATAAPSYCESAWTARVLHPPAPR